MSLFIERLLARLAGEMPGESGVLALVQHIVAELRGQAGEGGPVTATGDVAADLAEHGSAIAAAVMAKPAAAAAAPAKPAP